MEIETVLEIIKTSDMNEYRKESMIQSITENIFPKINIEKYKIDKMIENNLIKESDNKEKLKQKIIETVLDKKFQMAYIATLFFILSLVNSINFWNWMKR